VVREKVKGGTWIISNPPKLVSPDKLEAYLGVLLDKIYDETESLYWTSEALKIAISAIMKFRYSGIYQGCLEEWEREGWDE